MVTFTSPAAHGNFIGGEFTEVARSFESINPADREDVVAVFPSSSSDEAAAAIETAADAFREWGHTPAVARGKYLSAMARLIRDRVEEFGRTITREEGMPLAQARAEVGKAADYFDYYAGLSYEIGGRILPSVRAGVDIRMEPEPLGVVVAITPWNVPLGIPARKVAPALVCGNAVVVKPSVETPLSCHFLAEVALEAGLPAGVLNIVYGSGSTLGGSLVSDPRTRAISFTGSTEVGRNLARKAGERLIRAQLELGGKNASVVLDDCDLDNAVRQITLAGYAGSGQQCTATSRVIVQRDILGEFTERLVERVRDMKVGPGLEDSTQMGPMVSERQLEKVLGYVDIGRSEGAEVLSGGERLTGETYERGWFMAPTVLGSVDNRMRVAQEEIFGPVLAVIPADSDEEALEMTNASPYGLSAAVFTESLSRARYFTKNIEAGAVAVNLPSAGWEVQTPFGGVKESGGANLKEQGLQGLEFFRELKAVQEKAISQ